MSNDDRAKKDLEVESAMQRILDDVRRPDVEPHTEEVNDQTVEVLRQWQKLQDDEYDSTYDARYAAAMEAVRVLEEKRAKERRDKERALQLQEEGHRLQEETREDVRKIALAREQELKERELNRAASERSFQLQEETHQSQAEMLEKLRQIASHQIQSNQKIETLPEKVQEEVRQAVLDLQPKQQRGRESDPEIQERNRLILEGDHLELEEFCCDYAPRVGIKWPKEWKGFPGWKTVYRDQQEYRDFYRKIIDLRNKVGRLKSKIP